MTTAERLYYSDPALRSFTGAVTAIRELPGAQGEPLWQIALDRTAFYPTSGGQPFDTGVLKACGSETEIAIEQVEEDDSGEVWHFVRQPLPVGTQIEGLMDWQRRFDHMQQHTGQHLLSAVFVHELKAPTVSFHLGQDSSAIDLAISQLAHHSIERVERIANEIIAEDRPVTIDYASRDEAEAMLASGELRKLPDREGSIRLINIANFDRNACGGTHVRSTGQIGSLLIRNIEKVSRGMRVEFLCGLRAVRAARSDAAILTETAGLLSSATAELPSLIRQLLADNKAGTKERQKLREELAAYHATTLIAEAPAKSENAFRLIVRRFKDRDRDYVRLLASRTASAAPSTAIIFSMSEGQTTRLFIARGSTLTFDCGRILREILTPLGLRGGGSPDLAQSEVPSHQEPAIVAALSAAIRAALQC